MNGYLPTSPPIRKHASWQNSNVDTSTNNFFPLKFSSITPPAILLFFDMNNNLDPTLSSAITLTIFPSFLRIRCTTSNRDNWRRYGRIFGGDNNVFRNKQTPRAVDKTTMNKRETRHGRDTDAVNVIWTGKQFPTTHRLPTFPCHSRIALIAIINYNKV